MRFPWGGADGGDSLDEALRLIEEAVFVGHDAEVDAGAQQFARLQQEVGA